MRVPLSADVNFFVGQNGQGKTNLLEGLYLLAGFRSFRGAKNRDVVEHGGDFAQLEATIEADGLERAIKLAFKDGSKTYLVDGKAPQSLADWIGNMVVVTFSPDDLYLVKGEPELRRRWLDRIIFLLRPKHLGNVLAYQKALKSRNVLLKDGMYGRDLMLLDSFDETLARYGSEVVRERALWSEEVGRLVAEELGALTGDKHHVGVFYESELKGLDAEQTLAELIRRREDDVRRRQTRWGAHHDDIVLHFDERPARRFASQGEQRGLTLALKLAETQILRRERGVDPVLLLDDVIGELDSERHELLFRRLRGSKGQVFVAGTEIPASFSDGAFAGARFSVENGEIRQIN